MSTTVEAIKRRYIGPNAHFREKAYCDQIADLERQLATAQAENARLQERDAARTRTVDRLVGERDGYKALAEQYAEVLADKTSGRRKWERKREAVLAMTPEEAREKEGR